MNLPKNMCYKVVKFQGKTSQDGELELKSGLYCKYDLPDRLVSYILVVGAPVGRSRPGRPIPLWAASSPCPNMHAYARLDR